jgi:hypothetical protein
MRRLTGLFSPYVPAVLAVAVLMTVSRVAAPQPSLVGTPSDVTGIDGLVVAGQAYNVTFSQASYDTLFTGSAPPPLFLNSPTVFLTEAALNSFFSTHPDVTGILGNHCVANNSCSIFVPSGTYTNNFGIVFINGAGTGGGKNGWGNFAGAPGFTPAVPLTGGSVYAVFAPAPHVHGTPEIDLSGAPAALTLLASVLAALHSKRRQRP